MLLLVTPGLPLGAHAQTRTNPGAARPEPLEEAAPAVASPDAVPDDPGPRGKGLVTVPQAAGRDSEASQAAAKAEIEAAASGPPIAAPAPQFAEARYMARMDELIASVRDFVPSANDVAQLKEAIRANAAGDATRAKTARAMITDPAVRKLAEWLLLKSGRGEPGEFTAFVAANPAWPEQQLLIKRAEEQLFTQGGAAPKIKAFFAGSEPKSGAGLAALASACLAEGDESKARLHASRAWRDFDLPAALETGFLDRFGKLLTEADHKRRLDRILVDEVRFTAPRNDRGALARRVIPLLSEPERRKAEARLAVFLQAKQAGQLLSKLAPDPPGKVDWGLAFSRVVHHRRSKEMDEAWKILIAAPTDPELIISPDDWWGQRRAAAHEALKGGQPKLAYSLVRDAGPLSVNPLKEQSFMAGWLALRYLDKTEAALAHFLASRQAADGPLSKARADYWAGRALEKLGRTADAKLAFAKAAEQIDTFHGQLGRLKLGAKGARDLSPKLPAVPSHAQAQAFNALDAVRAAVVAAKSGLDSNIQRALFGHLRNYLETEAEVAMLAHLGSALGDAQTSLRVGKTGLARGMNLIVYAYPLHTFPSYTPLRTPPEPAMLLGIARQETEFNTSIISTAGARGLLQVMPVTAQHTCRDYKIKCDISRLLTDNSYNAMIASAYVGDRMAEFRGNYVLTLAGYNAGPGRARQWIKAYGDPRDAGIDPLDWIENIPIEETREYVKKVLSNIQIYRARLGEAAALRLEDDLTRSPGGGKRAERAEPSR